MDDPHLHRILRRTAGNDLLQTLAEELPGSDLQTLLLTAYRRRVERLVLPQVLRQYADNRFVRPSDLDPRVQLAFDQLAFAALPPDYQALELAPVCPLGTSSVVARLSQDRALTTIRNTEVCSDPTNVLALECIERRQQLRRLPGNRNQRVRLAASHRVVRPQLFDHPHALSHFRLFALCSAGRREAHWGFETASLREHLGFYLTVLASSVTLGLQLREPRLLLTDLDGDERTQLWREQVLDPLARTHPDVRFDLNQERQEGQGYYTTARFGIQATTPTGEALHLVDGGFTDWTEAALGDRKERLLISGLGSERLCRAFAVAGPDPDGDERSPA